MATSAYPAFSAALLAALEAASWPVSTPQIADGADIVPDVQREYVLLGNAEADEDWTVLGNRRKNEKIKQYVNFRVNRVGDTQVNTNARCFQLLGVLETILRADPTVAGTVLVAQLRGWKFHKTGNEAEKYAELIATVSVDYVWI